MIGTILLLVTTFSNVSANCNPCSVTKVEATQKSTPETKLFVRLLIEKQDFIEPYWDGDYAFISSDLTLSFCPSDTRRDNTKDLVKYRIGGDSMGGYYSYSYPALPCKWLTKPEFEQHIKNREKITSSLKYEHVHKEPSYFNGALTSSKVNSGFLLTWE